MKFSNRNYIILPVSEIDKIDFTQVLESSPNTLRTSVDGSKTFVKWDGNEPSCISNISNTEGPYTHSEMLSILKTSEWNEPIEETTED